MIAGGDPLRQLPPVLPGENIRQFRLPDQYDLQKLLPGGLQVGQYANLLQRLPCKHLRFVDNQDGAQVCHRLPVPPAHVQVAGGRGDGKRSLGQAKR